jgi:hypothetical protein
LQTIAIILLLLLLPLNLWSLSFMFLWYVVNATNNQSLLVWRLVIFLHHHLLLPHHLSLAFMAWCFPEHLQSRQQSFLGFFRILFWEKRM